MTGQSRERPMLVPDESDHAEAALRLVVSQRLREFRTDLDWTLSQLAGRSGVSRAMLAKMENARATPTMAPLARIGAALSVPVPSFFRGRDEEHDLLHVKSAHGLEIQQEGSTVGQRYQHLGRRRFPHDR